jgi:hypothetical protein
MGRGEVSAEAGEPIAKSLVLGRGIIRGRVLAPPEKELPDLLRVEIEGPLSGSCAVASDVASRSRARSLGRTG